MGERRRRQSRYLEKLSALSLDVGEIVLSKCPWKGLASPQPEAVRSYLPPPPPTFSVKGTSGLGTFGLLVLSTLSLVTGIIPVRGGGGGRSVSAERLRPLLISRTGLVGGLLGRSQKGLPWFFVVGVLGFGPRKTSQGWSMVDRPGRTWFWGRRLLFGLVTLGSLIKNSGNELVSPVKMMVLGE